MASIRSHIHALETFVELGGAQVSHQRLPNSVHGRVDGNVITLRGDLNPRQELVALVHEATHWLAHRGAHSPMDCTIFEYEAEAVEALVLSRLGLTDERCNTDDLLSASVARVISVSERICGALGLESEPQTSVHLQAASRKEVVLEYEEYGMGNFFGLPEAL
jgi:hypothetical protein